MKKETWEKIKNILVCLMIFLSVFSIGFIFCYETINNSFAAREDPGLRSLAGNLFTSGVIAVCTYLNLKKK